MAASNKPIFPPEVKDGSMVSFRLKKSEYLYQGTVSNINPQTTSMIINDVKRIKDEISEPNHSFFLKICQTQDFKVIQQLPKQSSRNQTNTKDVHNTKVGDGLIGSSRSHGRDSTNTKDDDDDDDDDEALKKVAYYYA
ncbi:unnamed protein product [Cochlearia groenlandica]